jgi:cytochrome c oxidase subunit 2
VVTRLAFLGLLSGLAFLFSGCDIFSSPQNTFAPAGEVAEDQKRWFIYAMIPALAVFFLVQLGCVFIVLKFRKRKGDDGLPKQIHGHNVLEITWTVIPAILLFAFIPLVVGGIVKLGDTPEGAMTVEVNAFRYGWLFGYPAPDGTIITGDASSATDPGPGLYVPQGQVVKLQLRSDDVIHSFWVPKLAGKTDVIPGHTNHMWIKSDTLGDYSAQCAEFCGLNHAYMRFHVKVVTQAEYDAYVGGLVAARDGVDDTDLVTTGD